MPFPFELLKKALVVIIITISVVLNLSAQSKRLHQKNARVTKTGEQKSKTRETKNKSKETRSKRGDKQDRKASLEAKIRAREERRRLLEERRRREEAIRQARAQQLAFERRLLEQTIENIKNDQIEGEDLEIRRAVIDALGRHAGTAIVMETQTGRILTIVNQDWAVRHSFKPCSTIKLVTAIAGLNEGIIERNGQIAFQPFRLDLTDALAFSNNTYFQQVGSRLGSEKFITYAQMLGLGQKTGINLENESLGKLPYAENNLRMYSHGDSTEVTPIQLAVMVSAIANNGKVVVPQIPRLTTQKTSFQGILRRQLQLPEQTLQGVLPGMIGAVNYGTAKSSGGAYLNVAGKTGSCIGQGSWLGLFASVAPVVNPQYTVVVVTRGSRERGRIAAAIAGEIYRALERNPYRNRNFQLAKKEELNKVPIPKPKVDEKISLLIDGGADEEIDDIISTKSQKRTSITIDSLLEEEEARTSKKSEIEKSNSTKQQKQDSVFKPIIIEPKKKEDKEDIRKMTRPRIVKTVTNTRVM